MVSYVTLSVIGTSDMDSVIDPLYLSTMSLINGSLYLGIPASRNWNFLPLGIISFLYSGPA